jgi:hypothetical protein
MKDSSPQRESGAQKPSAVSPSKHLHSCSIFLMQAVDEREVQLTGRTLTSFRDKGKGSRLQLKIPEAQAEQRLDHDCAAATRPSNESRARGMYCSSLKRNLMENEELLTSDCSFAGENSDLASPRSLSERLTSHHTALPPPLRIGPQLQVATASIEWYS